jgi:membrane associated rhomboid family serine protease
MSLRLFSLFVTDAVMKITAVGCAICLYRFAKRPKRSPAIVSALIIGMTALTTSLQFVFPEILRAFRRNPEALLAGEWWRVVTPLFVQSNGLRQCAGNGVAAIIFLPLAELFYGKRLWALYFIPGVTGEVFAYVWGLDGAGSSLGIAGVMGSVFALAFLYQRELPGLVPIAAMFGLIAAVVLCFCGGSHGPPMLIGLLLASTMTRLWPNHKLEQNGADLSNSFVGFRLRKSFDIRAPVANFNR